MKESQSTNETGLPVLKETACGGRIRATPDTPSIDYQGETIYFCGWDCKELYDQDPLNSCLASRLLSGK